MKVHLTFDIEIWCNGWKTLDRDFPSCYSRCVFGHSYSGNYALPKILEMLCKNNLHGIFFVEPLFSQRFGEEFLERIVGLVRDAGQEVQLHVHPEWVDETDPPLLANGTSKRQHLSYYSAEEQRILIALGKKILEDAGSGPISAFRAGNFGANLDTFSALQSNGIHIDSSLNACHRISAPELHRERSFSTPFMVDQVCTHPVSIFRDGFGRVRPAQVGACSTKELQQAMLRARPLGHEEFVILSHNFEMLKPDSNEPDPIVVHRFERLCRFLAEHRDSLPTLPFRSATALPEKDLDMARAGAGATTRRVIEQAWRYVA
jgi:peptidoglycan/xylan/chitin deacetylase (PgdA/CDA1 family)